MTQSLTAVELGEDATLAVPASATDDEAAAIAAAVGAHLNDRQRAAAKGAETRAPRSDPWTLHGRMRALGKRRYSRDVKRGEEWKAAARAFDR